MTKGVLAAKIVLAVFLLGVSIFLSFFAFGEFASLFLFGYAVLLLYALFRRLLGGVISAVCGYALSLLDGNAETAPQPRKKENFAGWVFAGIVSFGFFVFGFGGLNFVNLESVPVIVRVVVRVLVYAGLFLVLVAAESTLDLIKYRYMGLADTTDGKKSSEPPRDG